MEPSIFNGFGSKIGVLEIALKDVRPLGQDLTIISDLHLHTGDRLPHKAPSGAVFALDSNNSGGFRLPVALSQGDAEGIVVLKEFR